MLYAANPKYQHNETFKIITDADSLRSRECRISHIIKDLMGNDQDSITMMCIIDKFVKICNKLESKNRLIANSEITNNNSAHGAVLSKQADMRKSIKQLSEIVRETMNTDSESSNEPVISQFRKGIAPPARPTDKLFDLGYHSDESSRRID